MESHDVDKSLVWVIEKPGVLRLENTDLWIELGVKSGEFILFWRDTRIDSCHNLKGAKLRAIKYLADLQAVGIFGATDPETWGSEPADGESGQ